MQRSRNIIQRQILLTLSYSNIFKQPLTEDEVLKRLIVSSANKAISTRNIASELVELKKMGLLNQDGKYWQLTSISKNLANLRKKRIIWSEKKLLELQPFLDFVQSINWIKGVAITGSVSMKNAEEKDDVDLMIIVRRNRLWLVRPLLVLFSFLHGKRRSWNHEEYNSWCLNLWLDEDSLQVHPASQSLYVAYEVCQAEWVVIKDNIAEQFLVENSWVRKYVPEYYSQKIGEFLSSRKITSTADLKIIDHLNQLAYRLQLWYMRRHMTREKVSLSAAFFHPRDTKGMILNNWKQIVLRLKTHSSS